MVEVEWGVFSLAIINFEAPMGEFDPNRGKGVKALRTAIAVRDRVSNEAMADYYGAIGHRIFEGLQDPEEATTITGALRDADLTEGVLADALADPETWEKLLAEHTWLTSSTRSFGVPTIQVGGPGGPATFGPVISNPPDNDEDAVALWRHTAWLTRYENFSELKRDRSVDPDLAAWRARQ